MANTGYKGYATLEQYYTENGAATGVTKANDLGDPDYIAPVYDLTACPIDTIAPSIPTNLVLFNMTSSTLVVHWDSSTDNTGIDHYVIYVNGALYATTNLTTASIIDLQPSTTYLIGVSAVDVYYNESAIGGDHFTTAPASYSIDLDLYSADIDYNAQLVIFNITSNYPSYTFVDYPAWLSVSGGSGGNQQITLHITRNNTGMERYGSISIVYNGGIIATFNILQQ